MKYDNEDQHEAADSPQAKYSQEAMSITSKHEGVENGNDECAEQPIP